MALSPVGWLGSSFQGGERRRPTSRLAVVPGRRRALRPASRLPASLSLIHILTGVDEETIAASARMYANAERGAIQWGLPFDTQVDSMHACLARCV